MRALRGVWTAVAVALAGVAAGGTVEGRVELLEKGGKPARDLSGVVVYLEDVDSDAPLKPETVTISMKRKAFSPRLAVIPVGGTVEFPNQDPIYHNVFSVSAPNKFDLDLYKKPKSGSWTFQHPGVVKVYCNIHPQMRAVVLVRDNPWYARAAEDGSFRLEGVPPGTHTLTAWHERASSVSTEVTVSDGEGATTAAALTLDASKFKFKRHKNKNGKAYRKKDY